LKMRTIGIIVLVIQVSLFFQGCGPLEYLDGSSKNEIHTFKTSKSEMEREIEQLRSENKALRRKIDVLAILEKEHSKLIDEREGKLAEIRNQNKLLEEKLRSRNAEYKQLQYDLELAKLMNKNELGAAIDEKQALSDMLNRQETENQRLREALDRVKAQLKDKNALVRQRTDEQNELDRLRTENEALYGKMNELEAENQRLRDDLEVLKLRDKNQLATLIDKKQLLSDMLSKEEAENQRLRDEIDKAKAQLKDKNELVRVNIGETNELARMRDENELLREQVKHITSENQRIKYENKALVKMLTRRGGGEKPSSARLDARREDLQDLNIKVLSRESKDFAERIAEKLREMGYPINSVGYAPRSRFLPNTVYFALEFKEEAEHLVANLGGGAKFEPLKLPSVFDLIVVTGGEE